MLSTRLTHLFIRVVMPWLQRYLLGTAVKQAGKKTLGSTPLNFEKPNLLLAFISVMFLNSLHFLITLFHTDSKVIPVISAICVSIVTAFFLLRGFFSPRTKRERTVLLIVMLFFLALYLLCFTVFDVKWLAFVSKILLEMILCWAVMLSELHRLNSAQSMIVDKIMHGLNINPEKRIGKIILKYGKVADESLSAITRDNAAGT